MNTTAFNEVQGFRTWWVWTAIIALNLLFIYAIIQQVFLGIPFGSKPASSMVLFLSEAGMLLLLGFLFSIRLKTSIDDQGIHYRYYPFQAKATLIEWDELSDAFLREYDTFYEFGGHGIRVGSWKNNRAINTSASCNEGLQLEFKDGRMLLIGTARPDELKKIIQLHKLAGKIRWGT